MQMCRVEKLLINNRVRRRLWEKKEFPLIRGLIRPTENMRTLELGAGMGIGTESLLAAFPGRIVESTVTDYDPAQLKRARSYLPPRTPEGVQLNIQQADASALPFPEERFDLVCCFGMLHHVPKWQQAVVECARVLRPGGQFVMLDTSRRTFRWIGFLFPPEATFTLSEAVDAATAAGLKELETIDAGGWFFYLAGIK